LRIFGTDLDNKIKDVLQLLVKTSHARAKQNSSWDLYRWICWNTETIIYTAAFFLDIAPVISWCLPNFKAQYCLHPQGTFTLKQETAGCCYVPLITTLLSS